MPAAHRSLHDPEPGLAGLPCGVCGQASVGWVYTHLTDDEGNDVIEAYSACDAHRLELVAESEIQAI